MTSRGPEELLWELAGNEGRDGVENLEFLTEERLQAYRAGELGEEEVVRLETALAASPEARERLAALAGTELEAPPDHVRQRVLAAAPGTGKPIGKPAMARSASGRRWWLSAAAAIVLAVVFLPTYLDRDLPAGLDFDVTATGKPPARSLTPTAGAVPTLATTRVNIVVEPQVDAVSGLEFGLYRVDGANLKRLDLDPAVEREISRGTARFSAIAQRLVGATPGNYEVFVAVAREGDLPVELAMPASADAASTLEANGRRRVYRQMIHLLPSAP